MKKSLLLLTVLLWNSLLFAQTTAVPDDNFEEALIYQGIDTDGIVNGQVATADIENITSLDVSDRAIYDLSGIEGFTNLEELYVSYNLITALDLSQNTHLKIVDCQQNELSNLDLSQNTLLEVVLCGNVEFDVFPQNNFANIDLSNNPLVKTIGAGYMYLLDVINLRNGANLQTPEMSINLDTFDEVPNSICIQVDDEVAANNGELTYADWEIYGYGPIDYSYSENCALGTKQFSKNTVRLYPNPSEEEVHLKGMSPTIQQVEIFNLQGKRVKLISDNFETINLTGLTSGVYFVRVRGENGLFTKKLIKN